MSKGQGFVKSVAEVFAFVSVLVLGSTAAAASECVASPGTPGTTGLAVGDILDRMSLAEEKFRWPRRGEELIALTGQQINWLLDGYDITLLSGHRKLHYESVF